jgi:hypothetical protein
MNHIPALPTGQPPNSYNKSSLPTQKGWFQWTKAISRNYLSTCVENVTWSAKNPIAALGSTFEAAKHPLKTTQRFYNQIKPTDESLIASNVKPQDSNTKQNISDESQIQNDDDLSRASTPINIGHGQHQHSFPTEASEQHEILDDSSIRLTPPHLPPSIDSVSEKLSVNDTQTNIQDQSVTEKSKFKKISSKVTVLTSSFFNSLTSPRQVAFPTQATPQNLNPIPGLLRTAAGIAKGAVNKIAPYLPQSIANIIPKPEPTKEAYAPISDDESLSKLNIFLDRIQRMLPPEIKTPIEELTQQVKPQNIEQKQVTTLKEQINRQREHLEQNIIEFSCIAVLDTLFFGINKNKSSLNFFLDLKSKPNSTPESAYLKEIKSKSFLQFALAKVALFLLKPFITNFIIPKEGSSGGLQGVQNRIFTNLENKDFVRSQVMKLVNLLGSYFEKERMAYQDYLQAKEQRSTSKTANEFVKEQLQNSGILPVKEQLYEQFNEWLTNLYLFRSDNAIRNFIYTNIYNRIIKTAVQKLNPLELVIKAVEEPFGTSPKLTYSIAESILDNLTDQINEKTKAKKDLQETSAKESSSSVTLPLPPKHEFKPILEIPGSGTQSLIEDELHQLDDFLNKFLAFLPLAGLTNPNKATIESALKKDFFQRDGMSHTYNSIQRVLESTVRNAVKDKLKRLLNDSSGDFFRINLKESKILELLNLSLINFNQSFLGPTQVASNVSTPIVETIQPPSVWELEQKKAKIKEDLPKLINFLLEEQFQKLPEEILYQQLDQTFNQILNNHEVISTDLNTSLSSFKSKLSDNLDISQHTVGDLKDNVNFTLAMILDSCSKLQQNLNSTIMFANSIDFKTNPVAVKFNEDYKILVNHKINELHKILTELSNIKNAIQDLEDQFAIGETIKHALTPKNIPMYENILPEIPQSNFDNIFLNEKHKPEQRALLEPIKEHKNAILSINNEFKDRIKADGLIETLSTKANELYDINEANKNRKPISEIKPLMISIAAIKDALIKALKTNNVQQSEIKNFLLSKLKNTLQYTQLLSKEERDDFENFLNQINDIMKVENKATLEVKESQLKFAFDHIKELLSKSSQNLAKDSIKKQECMLEIAKALIKLNEFKNYFNSEDFSEVENFITQLAIMSSDKELSKKSFISILSKLKTSNIEACKNNIKAKQALQAKISTGIDQLKQSIEIQKNLSIQKLKQASHSSSEQQQQLTDLDKKFKPTFVSYSEISFTGAEFFAQQARPIIARVLEEIAPKTIDFVLSAEHRENMLSAATGDRIKELIEPTKS